VRKSLVVLSFMVLSTPAFAASIPVNGNTVQANVAGNCVMVNPFTLDFGSYDPVGTNASTDLDVAAANQLQIKCTKKTSYTVDLDNGLNANGPLTLRGMLGVGASPDTLMYNIFTTAGRTTIWGTSMTGGAMPLAALSTSSTTTINIPIFGRIPAGQDVGVDNYQDTVVATVNF
jgi:spore coat protein U domain-containing protein, fimbrial subunit CupE1/2/3/6